MSRSGGDNHFITARDRDLTPLLAEGRAELELDGEKREMLGAFLETAWITGTRSGHAKLLNQAIRERQAHAEDWEAPPAEPVQMQDLTTEFKAMMESAAEALALPISATLALWDLLTRAWTAGLRTYEAEVLASLIERRSDIADEATRWLSDGDGAP